MLKSARIHLISESLLTAVAGDVNQQYSQRFFQVFLFA